MNIIASLRERVDRLARGGALDVEVDALPTCAAALPDESLLQLLAEVAAIANDAGRLQTVLAGVAAHRSRREHGHTGLAATQGHATPQSLIQAITGTTRADATRHVRVGMSLMECPPDPDDAREQGQAAETPRTPWHTPLQRALLGGTLTTAQHDAIRTGLGEPGLSDRGLGDRGLEGPGLEGLGHSASADAVIEAWSLAAESLIVDAQTMPTEELAKKARTLRDLLDPVGAEARFALRYENRSWRMWVDGDGQHRARIAFDDEMALWVRTLLNTALRPRRGGPRFVADDERAAAAELAADPRTNEQLEYDLMMDMLRAGSLASASDVFGSRQPGVRMVVIKNATGPRDALGRLIATGHAEDGGDALPGTVIDRSLCMNGSIQVTVDSCGNPLDLGREQRLYTARQRLTLAVRDGGCLWPACQRPASFCEAHHCDHYVEDDGRTDIDRGVLLCRFHHMLLHNNGWRITRDRSGPFVLHPPSGHGQPIALHSKAAWKWAWDPPPPPPRASWRTG